MRTVQSEFAGVAGDPSTVAMVTVSLSAAATKTVTVEYSTADGDAVAGSDYVETSGTPWDSGTPSP